MADIPNPTPIVKAAVPEKTFDKQFCTDLRIDAKPELPWNAAFVGVPFDGVEIIDDKFIMRLKDLKALAVVDAELAQAMGAVLAVIGKYLVKGKLKNIREVTDKNIEELLL